MSLGKDLASIRESQNLTLNEVQKAIKIPLLTLKSIEDDSIFSDETENKTYRRSFIRSYAKLLRLDDDNVVRALDAMDEGTYRSEILTGIKPTGPEETAEYSEYDEETDEPSTPPPVNTPQVEPKPNVPPTINTVNWADMGRKFNTVSKGSKTWIILVTFILVVLIGGGAYIFSDQLAGLFDSDPSDNLMMDDEEPITTIIDTSDSSQPTSTAPADASDPQETTDRLPPQPITLGDTLTIAVYAAFGQLEPIRVTSDYNWRTNPFWMEEGEAYYFDFQDTILVRGQYSRLLLLFNGHPIDDPLQNYFNPDENSIMITRSDLSGSKYLAAPPSEFPYEIGPPDSIVYRLRF